MSLPLPSFNANIGQCHRCKFHDGKRCTPDRPLHRKLGDMATLGV